MNPEEKTSETKKPYDPPRATTISLRPEEAVLGHCKIASVGGPGGGCALFCFNVGS